MKYNNIYKKSNNAIINDLKQHGTPPSYGRMKGCLAKIGYDSEFEAQVMAAQHGLTEYKCNYCSHWHLTSQKGRK